jgi:GT2 family glycosyltransferase
VSTISIITITYNNYDELLLTLDSLSGLKSHESIVINGGSCPLTRTFLQNVDCKSISEIDDGISDAFNKGFCISSGEYVTFLNSGDVMIDSHYYADALKIFELDPSIAFIYADLYFLDKIAGPIRLKSGRALPYMPFLHPTLVVRRDLIHKIGLFDRNYKIAMDLDFAYRLVRSGARGYYIPRMVVRMDGEGVSSTQHVKHYIEVFSVILKNKDYSIRGIIYIIGRAIILGLKMVVIKIGAVSFIKRYRTFRYGLKKP